MTTILWVSAVITVAAFIVDGLLWSFVFNKGMDHLMSLSKDEAAGKMASFMGKQVANQVFFALGFTYFFSLVRSSLPAQGVVGGLLFGLLIWAPTVAHEALSNSIWYGKARALANATAWSSLAKFLVSGALAAWLIK